MDGFNGVATKYLTNYIYWFKWIELFKTDKDSIKCKRLFIQSHTSYSNTKIKDFKIQERKVKTVIVAHKDRFTRFGFDWFEKFINKCGGEIIVVNNEKLSPQEELIQDLISIIHVFSCRIYGLRKYKKNLEKELLQDNVKNI